MLYLFTMEKLLAEAIIAVCSVHRRFCTAKQIVWRTPVGRSHLFINNLQCIQLCRLVQCVVDGNLLHVSINSAKKKKKLTKANSVLLFGIKRVVIGENSNFMGEEELLRSRGVEVICMNNADCKDMMKKFIADNPSLVERGHWRNRLDVYRGA